MRRGSAGFLARTLVTAVAMAWAIGIALAAPAPPPQAAGYVGDDTCTTCHEPEGKSLRATLHGKAQNARTPAAKAGQSCETCHGPGQAHVDAGDNSHCLTCHSKGSHGQWNGGVHDARNLSCATCHSVHNPKSERAQLKTVTA